MDPTAPVLAERPGWKRASAWGALYWVSFVALVTARRVYAGYAWPEAVQVAVPYLLPALALTPVVLWLASRFPLERPHAKRHAALHLAASALLIGVGATLRRLLILALYPVSEKNGPFWAEYPTDVRDALRFMDDYWIILGLFYAVVYFRRWQVQQRRTDALERRLARDDETSGGNMNDGDAAPQRLLVRAGKKRVPIAVEAVRWVEAEDYCVRLHLGDERSLLYRRSLKDLEAALPSGGPRAFVRVHRSTLVRLGAIREVTRRESGNGYEVVLDDGTRRRVSRSRRPALLDALDAA